jgi:hypothetical protein
MDIDISEEYAASICRVEVYSMKNWCRYISRFKEGGHSNSWESIRKSSLIQTHGTGMWEGM